jgi:hypothetical protein
VNALHILSLHTYSLCFVGGNLLVVFWIKVALSLNSSGVNENGIIGVWILPGVEGFLLCVNSSHLSLAFGSRTFRLRKLLVTSLLRVLIRVRLNGVLLFWLHFETALCNWFLFYMRVLLNAHLILLLMHLVRYRLLSIVSSCHLFQ